MVRKLEYTFLNHVGFATQEDISPHIPFRRRQCYFK